MAEPWSSRVSSTIDIAASPTGSAHWIVHPASVTVGLRDLASTVAHRDGGRRAGEDGEPRAPGAEAGAQRHPAGQAGGDEAVGPLLATAPHARRLGGGHGRAARRRRRRRRAVRATRAIDAATNQRIPRRTRGPSMS